MGGYGALTWPASKLQSLCGDAPGEDRWDMPGPVQATYTAGQVVDIDVVIAVNHLVRRGALRFEVAGCSLSSSRGGRHTGADTSHLVCVRVCPQGRFEFQLCDLDAKPADASSRCIKLSRCARLWGS
jgi:hypothetical protein